MPSAKILTDTSSSSLETSLNSFLSTVTTVLSVNYFAILQQFSGGVPIIQYSVLVLYT